MALYTVTRFVSSLFDFYSWLVIIHCILSWFPRGGSGFLNDLRGALDAIVGPFLNVFRRWLPPMMGIDFSPVIAILALNLIERLVFNIIL